VCVRACYGLEARGPGPLLPGCSPGVSRMTEVTIREQMTRITSSAIAIPFQFLCGGLLPTSSYRKRRTKREKACELMHANGMFVKCASKQHLLGNCCWPKTNSANVCVKVSFSVTYTIVQKFGAGKKILCSSKLHLFD